MEAPLVGVVMGSKSDDGVMKHASMALTDLGIGYEVEITSAHRQKGEKMLAYAKRVESIGIRVVIAGAGGSAHLPGMMASLVNVPVLGVAIDERALSSLVFMPGGVPLATMGVGKTGAINAALMVALLLVGEVEGLAVRLEEYKKRRWG